MVGQKIANLYCTKRRFRFKITERRSYDTISIRKCHRNIAFEEIHIVLEIFRSNINYICNRTTEKQQQRNSSYNTMVNFSETGSTSSFRAEKASVVRGTLGSGWHKGGMLDHIGNSRWTPSWLSLTPIWRLPPCSEGGQTVEALGSAWESERVGEVELRGWLELVADVAERTFSAVGPPAVRGKAWSGRRLEADGCFVGGIETGRDCW